jgi:simple sugar transport system ATP-binding protein
MHFRRPRGARLGIATVYQTWHSSPDERRAQLLHGREPRRKRLFGLLPVMDHEYAAQVARDKLSDRHPSATRTRR